MVSGTEHLWQSSKSVVVIKFVHRDADKNAIRRCQSVISLQLKLAIQVGNWPQLTANLNGVRLAITCNQFVIIRWINCRKQTFTLNRKHSNDLHSVQPEPWNRNSVTQLSAISPSRGALVWRQDALQRSTCGHHQCEQKWLPRSWGCCTISLGKRSCLLQLLSTFPILFLFCSDP